MPLAALYRPLVAVTAALLISTSSPARASEDEPYRVLSPAQDGPHSAVLLVPGCSGFVALEGGDLYGERAEALRAAGHLVVFVDYVGRRYATDCRYVSRAELAQDILDAAGWARQRADVDPHRVSVIGWSYGGGGVLAALAAMPAGTPIIARAVTYYPDCRGAKAWSHPGIKVLMLMGAADEVARPALCNALTTQAPSDSLRTIIYPNAFHSFDWRSLPERVQYSFGIVGYNPEAAQSSWDTVLEFLK
jgi:dienelactone hydrolase